jgi:hypothetical protein
MRKVPVCVALSGLITFGAAVARADNLDSLVKSEPAASARSEDATQNAQKAPSPTAEVDKPAERRGGVVLGFNVGVGLSGSSGYPNNSNYIGDPNYYAASGLMTGSGGSFFLMGALSDYLSFGFWFGLAKFGNGQWYSSGGGGGLRLEIFPLYPLGQAFRDLGVATQVGIGKSALVYKDEAGVTSSGVGSFLSGGVFYEFWLFKALGGHFAGGPNLEYDAIFSEAAERHGALLGIRFLWYGGK